MTSRIVKKIKAALRERRVRKYHRELVERQTAKARLTSQVVGQKWSYIADASQLKKSPHE